MLRKLYQAEQQTLLRYSGSGNNFACGFFHYGEELSESFMELLQSQLESCDSLQGLCVFHSLGGGTGSGLGSKLLANMADALPKKLRLTASVLPSQKSQDVVTSPYNVILSLAQLTEYADLVLPIDNSKLTHLALDADKFFRHDNRQRKSLKGYNGITNDLFTSKVIRRVNTTVVRNKGCHNDGFKSMNMTAARILIDMTAGIRFNGDDCTRINEIVESICDARRRYITSSVSCTIDSRAVRQVSNNSVSIDSFD
jgi:tubulin epsilon